MGIFAGVPGERASNESEVIENVDFHGFLTVRLIGTLGNEANVIT